MLISAVLALAVMDKEWPLWLVLTGFLGCGLVGMLLCRKWPLMAIVILPLILIGGINQVLELNDPYVGEAIRREAGIRYVVLSYLAVGSSVILLVVGTLQGWARRKQSMKRVSNSR
jgi:hypothetical protein